MFKDFIYLISMGVGSSLAAHTVTQEWPDQTHSICFYFLFFGIGNRSDVLNKTKLLFFHVSYPLKDFQVVTC